jgi:hypothetical protein
MKLAALMIAATVTLASTAAGGVVFDIQTTDHRNDRVDNSQVLAQGRQLKITVLPSKDAPKDEDGNATMIFDAEHRSLTVVDDRNKSYFVLDEKAMKSMADRMKQAQSQTDAAMEQMKAQLDQVPEDQRAMIGKMMEDRLKAMSPPAEESETTPAEVRATGEKKTQNGYPTTKYDVYQGKRKIRELWVTDWSRIEGGQDVAELFAELSDFMNEMVEAMPKFGGMPAAHQANDAVFENLRKVKGFPVVTQVLDAKGVASESSMRSTKTQKLDPSTFQPPKGYRQRTMEEMGQGE